MKVEIRKILKVAVASSAVYGLPTLVQATQSVHAQTITIEDFLAKSNMSATQQQFIRNIYPAVQKAYDEYGTLPSVTMAQAILESGWGKSGLGSAPHYNLFGIKASSDWKGNVADMLTKEYVDGKEITVTQPFRSYSSYEESILDYSQFFVSTAWRRQNYAGYLKAKDYIEATNALQKAGYATSPTYASSLQRVIETYGLNQFDPEDRKVSTNVQASTAFRTAVPTPYTGLRANDNNELEYIENDVFKQITGLIPHENKHYYVVDGKWESTYVGLVTNGAGTYYVKYGIIDRSFTGFVWHDNKHYYMVNGRWAPTYTGLGTNPAGTFYVKQGIIDRSFTGFVWHDNKHYYIVNGRWAPTYTGLGTNPVGTFYVKQGIIDRGFTGFVWHDNKHYYIVNGKWAPTYTGLGTNPVGTYYVKDGIIDRSYTGLVAHENTSYYIVNGRWAPTYTGAVSSGNVVAYVSGGTIDNSKNGIVDYNQESYYFINGEVATSYSGQYLENMMAYEIRNGLVIKKVQTDISKVIFIDPGHGGIDSGAAYYGLKEKDLVLDVSKRMQSELQKQGYTVILSREDDRNIDFRTERSRMVNTTNSDLFVSVHFNASGRGEGSSAQGIETYWYEYDPAYQPKINQAMHNDSTRLQRSEWLANAIHQSVLAESGAANRGVRRDTFAVLRETAKPAALIELGFMDNYNESQQMRQESYRQKLADGLVKGIQKYYSDLIASYLK